MLPLWVVLQAHLSAKQGKLLGQASSHANPSQQVPAMTGTPVAYPAATPASTPMTVSNTAPSMTLRSFCGMVEMQNR